MAKNPYPDSPFQTSWDKGQKRRAKLWNALKQPIRNTTQVNTVIRNRWEYPDWVWKGHSRQDGPGFTTLPHPPVWRGLRHGLKATLHFTSNRWLNYRLTLFILLWAFCSLYDPVLSGFCCWGVNWGRIRCRSSWNIPLSACPVHVSKHARAQMACTFGKCKSIF